MHCGAKVRVAILNRMQHTPLEALPITGRRPERPWAPLAASVGTHAGLALLLFVLLHRRPPPVDRPATDEPPTATQTVVLAPPLATPAPRPRPRPVPPPVPERRVEPRPREIPLPQVKRGPENIPETPPTPVPPPTEARADPTPAGDPGLRAPAAPPSEVASAEAAFESETQRLFGRRNSNAPGGGAPQPIVRWNDGPTEPRDNDCTPRPRPVRPAGQPVTLEFVEGRVINERTGVPLGGAYLQMMGTPYSAFADDAGHYRLGFDRDLVDECRSQYVRVIARGVPPQLIVLGRGPGGTDIYLRP